MKKYIFITGILLAFFALTFNTPATAIKYDKQDITWSDDTVKTAKSETKVKSADEPKGGCHPSKCATKCGKGSTSKTAKSGCCPSKSGSKSHKEDPDKK